MQEIVYQNLAGEEVAFGAAPPFLLERVEGTGSPGVDRKTLRGSLQEGETTVSALRQPRELELRVSLWATSRRSLYQLRSGLCGVLSPGKAFDPDTGRRARITYRNDAGTWWTWAVPLGLPQWAKRAGNAHPGLKLSFGCDSPFWFSPQESGGGFDVSTTGFHFPVRFPVRFAARSNAVVLLNRGQVAAPVRITLHGRGEYPTLVNRTTGKRLRLVSPLPQGALLEIDTDPDSLRVQMTLGGVVTNAYGLLDVTTPLSDFTLAVGENRIVYEAGGGAAETAVALRWHHRWEGV